MLQDSFFLNSVFAQRKRALTPRIESDPIVPKLNPSVPFFIGIGMVLVFPSSIESDPIGRYYRRNGNGSSFIYRYKIEQDGYRLRDAQYFGLDKGKIKSANVLQNGDKYLMNNYHYTTKFLADEDSDISFTPDRSIDNEVPLSSKLHELIELMKKELITQEEYERKRKQLINSY